MDWQQLLSDYRIGRKEQKQQEVHRPPWQYDHDRITFSSAFRRLQEKAQVFPLSSSDYVRTRLTHSLEAAGVARSLGNLVGHKLQSDRPDVWPKNVNPLTFGMITSAAALAHDIGNPPFGHSGEDAIREWFKNSESVGKFANNFSERQRADFENFEGNAQGFRILVQLQMYREEGGMQLTAATLGAFTKYPAEVRLAKDAVASSVSHKKFGFFQHDAQSFEEIALQLGLLKRDGARRCWARHPLAFIVEAADDICYRIIDSEDAVQQKLLDHKTIADLLGTIAGGDALGKSERKADSREQINYLRSKAIGQAVDEVADAFMTHHDEILAGKFDQNLVSVCRCGEVFRQIRQLQKEHVFTNERVLRVEAAGFRVIGGLPEAFFNAVSDAFEKGGNAGTKNKKLITLVPEQYIGPGRKISESPYLRLLRITDYVCGMTDSYALDLYRNISGISLP
jgi:dGTPase